MTSTEPTSTSSGADSKSSNVKSTTTSSGTSSNDHKVEPAAPNTKTAKCRSPKPMVSADERTKYYVKRRASKRIESAASKRNSISDAGCVAEDFLIANTDSDVIDKEVRWNNILIFYLLDKYLIVLVELCVSFIYINVYLLFLAIRRSTVN